MNFNRSGNKYNPPAGWAEPIRRTWDALKELAVIPQVIVRKLSPRKSRMARHYDEHFNPPKRLHVVKNRGKGDHLTNQKRFEKNRERRNYGK